MLSCAPDVHFLLIHFQMILMQPVPHKMLRCWFSNTDTACCSCDSSDLERYWVSVVGIGLSDFKCLLLCLYLSPVGISMWYDCDSGPVANLASYQPCVASVHTGSQWWSINNDLAVWSRYFFCLSYSYFNLVWALWGVVGLFVFEVCLCEDGSHSQRPTISNCAGEDSRVISSMFLNASRAK